MTTRRADEQFTPQVIHVRLGLAAGAAEKCAETVDGPPSGAAAALAYARELWKLTFWQPGTDRETLARDGLSERLQSDVHAPAGLDYWAILHEVAAMTPGAPHAPSWVRGPYLPPPAPVLPVPAPAPPNRPAPVTTVAVLLYVGAGLTAVLALGVMAFGGMASYLADGLGVGFFAGRYTILVIGAGLFMLLDAAFSVVLGVALARGRRWAHVTTIALSALAIPFSLALTVPVFIFLNILIAAAHLIPLVLPTSRQFFTDHARARRA
jgi:hypothetical protein